jgi:hypothetical protein
VVATAQVDEGRLGLPIHARKRLDLQLTFWR